ncbi:hypothetical protein THAOC_29042, partial [Thalassiosira oceanica]
MARSSSRLSTPLRPAVLAHLDDWAVFSRPWTACSLRLSSLRWSWAGEAPTLTRICGFGPHARLPVHFGLKTAQKQNTSHQQHAARTHHTHAQEDRPSVAGVERLMPQSRNIDVDDPEKLFLGVFADRALAFVVLGLWARTFARSFGLKLTAQKQNTSWHQQHAARTPHTRTRTGGQTKCSKSGMGAFLHGSRVCVLSITALARVIQDQKVPRTHQGRGVRQSHHESIAEIETKFKTKRYQDQIPPASRHSRLRDAGATISYAPGRTTRRAQNRDMRGGSEDDHRLLLLRHPRHARREGSRHAATGEVHRVAALLARLAGPRAPTSARRGRFGSTSSLYSRGSGARGRACAEYDLEGGDVVSVDEAPLEPGGPAGGRVGETATMSNRGGST